MLLSRKTVLAVLLIALMTNHSLFAQAKPVVRSVQEIQEILKQRIDVEHLSVGIVVGIIDADGKRTIGYGALRAEGTTKPDGDTVFEIGSTTKVFTSLLLTQMIQQGEVKLLDPASTFLPPAVKLPTRNGKEITLLDLATHTSALPRLPTNLSPKDGLNPYADYTVEQMYQFLPSCKLERDIGGQYEYSNLGAGLLGHLLALRVGSDYETLVVNRICKPLGMTSTTIKLTPDAEKRLAEGHNQTLSAVKNWDIPTLAGAGALRSTANDMLKFVEANLGRTKTSLEAAMSEQLKTRRPTGVPDLAIALGWHVVTKFGSEIVWHNGQTGGYHSFIGFDKQRGMGVVVLSNCSNDIDDIGRHLLDNRYPLKKSPPQTFRKAIKVEPKILDSYIGEYVLAPTFIISITKEEGRLMLQATGQPKFEIFPESEKKFFLKVVDAQITFIQDDKGTVTQLILHQNGIDQTARKRAK